MCLYILYINKLGKVAVMEKISNALFMGFITVRNVILCIVQYHQESSIISKLHNVYFLYT